RRGHAREAGGVRQVRHDARRLQKSLQRQPAGRLCDDLGSEINDAGPRVGQLRIDRALFVGHENRNIAPLEAPRATEGIYRACGGVAQAGERSVVVSTQRTRPMPMRPDDDAPFEEKRNWLLQTHAYYPSADMVVDMYKESDECLLKRDAFVVTFHGWNEPRIG